MKACAYPHRDHRSCLRHPPRQPQPALRARRQRNRLRRLRIITTAISRRTTSLMVGKRTRSSPLPKRSQYLRSRRLNQSLGPSLAKRMCRNKPRRSTPWRKHSARRRSDMTCPRRFGLHHHNLNILFRNPDHLHLHHRLFCLLCHKSSWLIATSHPDQMGRQCQTLSSK